MGYAGNDPRHITRFQFSNFEIWKSRHVLKNVDNLNYYLSFLTGSEVPRGGNFPELCDWWWPASGGSAASEKTRPGFLEHVSCGFCRFLSILGSLQAPRGSRGVVLHELILKIINAVM